MTEQPTVVKLSAIKGVNHDSRYSPFVQAALRMLPDEAILIGDRLTWQVTPITNCLKRMAVADKLQCITRKGKAYLIWKPKADSK